MTPEAVLFEACVQVAHPRLGEVLAALPAPSLDLAVREQGMQDLSIGNRALVGQEPVYCHLPRGADQRARRVRVRGTAAVGAVWYGHRVLVVTAGLQIESYRSPRGWPEMLQHPGTAERLDSMGSRDWDIAIDAFLDGALPTDEDDRCLDLALMAKRAADRVAEVTSDLDSPGGRSTPFMRCRAALRFDPDITELSPPVVEVRDLVDAATAADGGFGLLVRVPASQQAAGDAVLAALAEVAAQLWLVEDASTSLRQQGHQLDRAFQAEGVGEHRRALRRLYRERANYLNEIESVLEPSARAKGPRRGELSAASLTEQASDALNLDDRRERAASRFAGIGEVAAGITDLEPEPRVPPSPPSFDDDVASRLVRSTSNPFRALRLWFDQAWHHRSTPASDTTAMADRHARAIELHPYQNRANLLGEVSSVLSLNAFMTATAGIFLSVVLQNGVAGDARSSPIPPYDILFLFLATFAFFFSTLIYGRAASRIARLGTVGVDSMFNTASSVSEYLGKYAFLIALPITVFRYLYGSTNANTISVGVAFLALCTLVAYQFLPYVSLLSEEIRGRRQIARGETEIEDVGGIGSDAWRRIFIVILTALTASAYFSALWPFPLLMHIACWCLVVLLILLMLFSFVAPERKNPSLYEVEDWDMLGFEEASLRDPHWRRDRV